MDKLTAFKIIPVLMIVAAIAFGVRFNSMLTQSALNDAATDLAAMEPTAGDAPAVDTKDASAKAPEQPPSDALKPAGEGDVAEEEADTEEPPAGGKPEIEAPSLGAPPKQADWKGADDLDDEYSEVKMEMFNDLTKRRKDIEVKEKEIAMREALLKAAQAELEQKYQEMTAIKTDIEDLLKKQTEQEDKRIASLVKIYEGMKAKDAARIFNTLDMDVLMQVVTKMSERKSAPILAAMDAEKARNVTIMLAEQNKLPSLPALDGGAVTP